MNDERVNATPREFEDQGIRPALDVVPSTDAGEVNVTIVIIAMTTILWSD